MKAPDHSQPLDYATPQPQTKPAFFNSKGVEALIGVSVMLGIVIPALFLIETRDRPWLFAMLYIGAIVADHFVRQMIRPWCERRFPSSLTDSVVLAPELRKAQSRREIRSLFVTVIILVVFIYVVQVVTK